MNTLLLMYLLGNANAIYSGFVAFGVLFLAISIILLIFALDHSVFPKKTIIAFLVSSFLCFVIGIVMPSSKTIMLMAGGSIVVEAAKTEQAQSIASNGVKVIDNYLKQILDEQEASSKENKNAK